MLSERQQNTAAIIGAALGVGLTAYIWFRLWFG